MDKRIVGGVLGGLLAVGGVVAQQDAWTVLSYPDPSPGVSKTYCYDLNEPGDLVGYRVSPGPPTRNLAFLFSDGEYYDLHPQNATQSYAYGINARGDIVGDYWIGLQEHGMLLSGGELIAIDLADTAMTHLRGINNRGDIVGFSMTTAASLQQAFLFERNGTVVGVQPPDSRTSFAYDINEPGDIVGAYTYSTGGTHGFLRTSSGEFKTLDVSGATQTEAWSINARGEVAGFYWDAQGISHGFRWYKDEFVTDDYPEAVHTMIHGMNNRGDTCGMMSFSTVTPLVWGGFAHTRGEI